MVIGGGTYAKSLKNIIAFAVSYTHLVVFSTTHGYILAHIVPEVNMCSFFE